MHVKTRLVALPWTNPFRCAAALWLGAAFLILSSCGGGSHSSVPSPPSVSAISPTSVTAGSAATTLTVTGSNFNSSSTVDFNGNALTTSFGSATKLTASLPASDLQTAGSFAVTVTNSASQTSNSVNFTVNNPTPKLSSISPSTLAVGSPDTTITLAGSNFVRTSQVVIGSAALDTTYTSPTQLTAIVPGSDLSAANTLQLAVNNPSPGGGASSSIPVTSVSVSAFVVLSAPATAGTTGNSWDVAVAAQQSDGTPIAGLSVALTASAGKFDQASGLTNSNGTYSTVLTVSNTASSGQAASISAVTGAQTAAVVIPLPEPSASAGRGRLLSAAGRRPGLAKISAQSSTTTFYNFTFSEGAAGSPGSTNPFDGANASCYQPDALTASTISTACQSAMTQDQTTVSPTTPLDEFCQTASDISTSSGVASCLGVVGTPVACAVANATHSKYTSLLCSGAISSMAIGLSPDCAGFLAELFARDYLHNPMIADAIALKFDPITGSAATFCTLQNLVTGTPPPTCSIPPTFSQPICSVGETCLFVANSGNNTITAYKPDGTSIPIPQGAFPGLNAPDGIAYDSEDEDLYVTNTGAGASPVTAYDLSGNKVCPGGQFALTNPFQSMGNPEDITYDPITKFLYINDPTNSAIYAFGENGFQWDLSGLGTTTPFAQINQPWGVFYNPTNQFLYVTNADDSLQLYRSNGGGPYPLSGNFPGLSSADDLAVDSMTGNVYVTEAAAYLGACTMSGLQEFSPNGDNVTPAGAFSAVDCPDSMVPVGGGGGLHLYVTNIYSNQITVYDDNGNDITSQVAPGGFQGVNEPTGIAIVSVPPASGSASAAKRARGWSATRRDFTISRAIWRSLASSGRTASKKKGGQ